MKRTTKQSHLLSLIIKPPTRLLNDGILDEIASVALLSRNDGISVMMEFPQS